MPNPPKPTREQIARRQDYVVEWSRKGCSVTQLAEALGVAPSTISSDRGDRRRQLAGVKMYGGGRHGNSSSREPDPPPPFDWAAPPPPKVERAYRISMMPRIQNLLAYLQESNARARLPYNIEEAMQAGDPAWRIQSQLLLMDAIKYLQDLLKILQDRGARLEAATSVTARDDLTVPTKAIASETPLPAPGTGVMPGRLYRTMMGYDYAGVEIDDEALADIARKETTTLARTQRAYREYRAAVPQISR